MNSSFCLQQIRRASQATLEKLRHIPNESLIWKANEDDPRKHTEKHEGLFYELPNDPKSMLDTFGTANPFTIKTGLFHKVIGQVPIMIRQPALKTMNYVRDIDAASGENPLPNVRIVLYGDHGNGKTHTLAHLIHFLRLKQDHVIISLKDVRKFSRSPWEVAESTSRPGRLDTPVNAAMFLQQFRVQNAKILEDLKDVLVCSKDYTWSLREITKAGDPVASIADHGVNRVNHASDCAAVLFKELMLAADSGKIKLATMMNYTKYLFHEEAHKTKHADHKQVYVDEITVARGIRKLIKNTYKNGLVIASCCDPLSDKQNQTPREVLGVDGWNHFDPFLPIHVPRYSRKEFESCMNFYQDIGWLTRPESRTEEVRDEIRFVSGMSPLEVHYLCQSI